MHGGLERRLAARGAEGRPDPVGAAQAAQSERDAAAVDRDAPAAVAHVPARQDLAVELRQHLAAQPGHALLGRVERVAAPRAEDAQLQARRALRVDQRDHAPAHARERHREALRRSAAARRVAHVGHVQVAGPDHLQRHARIAGAVELEADERVRRAARREGLPGGQGAARDPQGGDRLVVAGHPAHADPRARARGPGPRACPARPSPRARRRATSRRAAGARARRPTRARCCPRAARSARRGRASGC